MTGRGHGARPAHERWTQALFVVIGVFTATPVLSVVAPGQLASYGLVEPGAVELVLLQHRGVLQLLLGAALLGAAVAPRARAAVTVAALCSKGAFLALVAAQPGVAAQVSSVPLAFDAVSVVVLAGLLGLAVRRDRAGTSTP